MIELMKNFDIACEDISRLQDALKKALQLPLRGGIRAHLEELNKSITDAVAEARVALPQAEAEMNKDFVGLQKSLDEVNQKVSAAKENLEKAKAEAAAPKPDTPPAVEAPLDPSRGALLRKELLERFGMAKPREAEPVELGSIARHWEEADGAEEVEPPAPPVVPQPQTPAPAKSGLRPKSSRPLSQPPLSRPPKPKPAEPPPQDESIGKMSFDDE